MGRTKRASYRRIEVPSAVKEAVQSKSEGFLHEVSGIEWIVEEEYICNEYAEERYGPERDCMVPSEDVLDMATVAGSAVVMNSEKSGRFPSVSGNLDEPADQRTEQQALSKVS